MPSMTIRSAVTLLLVVPAAAFFAPPRRTAPAAAIQMGLFGGGGSKAGGVTVETVKPGDGVTYPKKGDTVKAHYTGKLTDGTQFDSSRGFLKPPFEFTIGVGQVIKGWDQGMMQMSIGEKATLTCTPDFGYGRGGAPPDIPPDATLVFDVELIGIS